MVLHTGRLRYLTVQNDGHLLVATSRVMVIALYQHGCSTATTEHVVIRSKFFLNIERRKKKT